MKKFLNIIFSRITVIAISLLAQIILFAIVMTQFSNYMFIFDAMLTLLSLVVIFYISDGRSNPVYKIAWIVSITAFPILGGIFYVMFGGIPMTKHATKLSEIASKMRELQPVDTGIFEKLENENKIAANQSRYINNKAMCSVHHSCYTRFFPRGEDFFSNVIDELKNAKKFIFLEFFIIEEGIMWNSILDILVEKVKEGVDVRVIYDDAGCLFKLPFNYNKNLESKGIKCCVFNPLLPFFSLRLNNRDHRKIIVIDGNTAYTGGVNIADEYINEVTKFGHWRDNAILVKDGAAWNFTVMFLAMWNNLRKTDSDYEKFKPETSGDMCGAHKDDCGYIQPFNDSPLDSEPISEAVYLNLINQSQKSIYIETPYLIADNKMMVALSLAAKRGVDVKIMVPHIPDKWYSFLVTQSNYEELMEAGVSIYEYTPGFNHGKVFIVDDIYAVVGTINLDYRSLYLHFECGVWIYNSKTVDDVKNSTLQALDVSQKITMNDIKNTPWIKRMVGKILKIFAPLM